MPAPLFNTIEERFDSLVSKTEYCWICSMTDSDTGYGRFPFKGKRYYAHRVSWEIYKGPVPKFMFVLHTCDNRPCCNPDHLFLGDDQDNSDDKVSKGRQNSLCGEFIHTSVLTEQDVRDIRTLLDKGESHRHLADVFNVAKSSITRIGNGSGWRHVK